MKERLLFHVRLRDSASPRRLHVKRTPADVGLLSQKNVHELVNSCSSTHASSGNLQEEEAQRLICTCIDSSSPCCVVVGFKRGVVHVYNRLSRADGDGFLGFEEERWKHAALYPTRALTNNDSSVVPPDITCVQRGPNGMLAVGTADGFVFVTQVRLMRTCNCEDRVALLSCTVCCDKFQSSSE